MKNHRHKTRHTTQKRYWSTTAAASAALICALTPLMGCTDNSDTQSTISTHTSSTSHALVQKRKNKSLALNDAGDAEIEFADKVQYLDKNVAERAIVKKDTITFYSDVFDAVKERQVGDVLVSDTGRGFWRVIESIETKDHYVRFHTRAARFNEVIENGKLSVTVGNDSVAHDKTNDASQQAEFSTRRSPATAIASVALVCYPGDEDCYTLTRDPVSTINTGGIYGSVGSTRSGDDDSTNSGGNTQTGVDGTDGDATSIDLTRYLGGDPRMNVYSNNMTAIVVNNGASDATWSDQYVPAAPGFLTGVGIARPLDPLEQSLYLPNPNNRANSRLKYEPALEFKVEIENGATVNEALMVSGHAEFDVAWDVTIRGNDAYQGAFNLSSEGNDTVWFSVQDQFDMTEIVSDLTWITTNEYQSDWFEVGADTTGWVEPVDTNEHTSMVPIPGTQAIWHPDSIFEVGEVYFRKEFTLDELPEDPIIYLKAGADDEFVAYINGVEVGHGNIWNHYYEFDIRPYLRVGENVIAISGNNTGGPGLITASITIPSGGDGHGPLPDQCCADCLCYSPCPDNVWNGRDRDWVQNHLGVWEDLNTIGQGGTDRNAYHCYATDDPTFMTSIDFDPSASSMAYQLAMLINNNTTMSAIIVGSGASTGIEISFYGYTYKYIVGSSGTVNLSAFASWMNEYFGEFGVQTVVLTQPTANYDQKLQVKVPKDNSIRFELLGREFVFVPEFKGAYDIFAGGEGKVRTGFKSEGYLSAGYHCDINGCETKSRSNLIEYNAEPVNEILSGKPVLGFRTRFAAGVKALNDGSIFGVVTPVNVNYHTDIAVVTPFCPVEQQMNIFSVAQRLPMETKYTSFKKSLFEISDIAPIAECSDGNVEEARPCASTEDCRAGEVCSFPDNICEKQTNLRISLIWNQDVDLNLRIRTPQDETLSADGNRVVDKGELVRTSMGSYVTPTCLGETPIICDEVSPNSGVCPTPCVAAPSDDCSNDYDVCQLLHVSDTLDEGGLTSGLTQFSYIDTTTAELRYCSYSSACGPGCTGIVYAGCDSSNESASACTGGVYSCNDFAHDEDACVSMPGCSWDLPEPRRPAFVERANFDPARMLLDQSTTTCEQVPINVNVYPTYEAAGLVEGSLVESGASQNVQSALTTSQIDSMTEAQRTSLAGEICTNCDLVELTAYTTVCTTEPIANQIYRVVVENVSGCRDDVEDCDESRPVPFTLLFELSDGTDLEFNGEVGGMAKAQSINFIYNVPDPDPEECTPGTDQDICRMYGVPHGTLAGPVMDNCGESRTNLNCGECSGPSCGELDCGTDQDLCAFYGKDCGSVSVTDFCGETKTISCGACPGGLPCSSNNTCCASRETDEELCLARAEYAGDQECLNDAAADRDHAYEQCEAIQDPGQMATCYDNANAQHQTQVASCQLKLSTYACGTISQIDSCGEVRSVDCSNYKPALYFEGSTPINHWSDLDLELDAPDLYFCGATTDAANNIAPEHIGGGHGPNDPPNNPNHMANQDIYKGIGTVEFTHSCNSSGMVQQNRVDDLTFEFAEDCSGMNYTEEPAEGSCRFSTPNSCSPQGDWGYGLEYEYFYGCRDNYSEMNDGSNTVKRKVGNASCSFYSRRVIDRNYNNPSPLCASGTITSNNTMLANGIQCKDISTGSVNSVEFSCSNITCECYDPAHEEWVDDPNDPNDEQPEDLCDPGTSGGVCVGETNAMLCSLNGETCGEHTFTDSCDVERTVICGYCDDVHGDQ